MDTTYQHLAEILSPAIILGVLAYLTNFFGKAISDQKPFADDRSWEIQLQGVFFFVLTIIPAGFVGFIISSQIGTLGVPFSMRAFLVLALVVWVTLVSQYFSQKLYGLSSLVKPEQKAAFKEKLRDTFRKYGHSEDIADDIENVFAAIWRKFESSITNREVPTLTVATFYMWMLIAEIQQYIAHTFSSAELARLIFLASLIFMGFFTLAFNKSLRMYKKLLIVDIYPVGGGEPIRNASLLKVNDTNVRFLNGTDKLVIMSRDRVERIEALRSVNPE